MTLAVPGTFFLVNGATGRIRSSMDEVRFPVFEADDYLVFELGVTTFVSDPQPDHIVEAGQ